MRTSNPIFSSRTFQNASSIASGEGVMTIQGTINRALILLFLLFVSASWIWQKIMAPIVTDYGFGASAYNAAVPAVGGWIMGGAIIGFIIAMVTSFNPRIAGWTSPVYALCEGVVLGGISAIFEMRYPGIVMNAVGLTFGTMFCMLLGYRAGILKATAKFRAGLTAAIGAIFLVYLVNFIMGFFGSGIPLIYSHGPFGIIFSLVVTAVAALSLILDFDFIEQASAQGMPKYMEWYGAFGLMVTLVWLYIELLRLLSKMRER